MSDGTPRRPRPVPHVTQRIAVSEGLALGFAVSGRWSIPFDTLAIHRAVVTAYLDWPQAPVFPQVHAELSSGLSGVHALMRADDTAHTFALYWARDTGTDGDLSPRSRFDDWTPDSAEDVDYAVESIAGPVTRTQWHALAATVITRLSE
ncbi:hypothetical protein QFZ62_000584 [Clavibacter sp. B3I6]|uniref:hypothetical protein n=1 Tax=Clavibacter sp. B3I6 TaxID=3042268 RepID=UPI00277E3EBF|nr:hypothetical protein [Clavibacter sp. B3I6]MDQ0743276.1 hypothetical protein [Clavibacter sp. B3I6]